MSGKETEKLGPVEMKGPGVDAWNGQVETGEPVPALMSDLFLRGLESKKFLPCVIYHEELRMTEMILEDTIIVWCPWHATRYMGHTVELGYNADGKLVGIQIWDDVRERPKR